MVKGIVKTNKANDTKYIYLSRDCGFGEGQEVDIKFSGIGIYDRKRLEEYFSKNKEMFLEIKKKLHEVNKKAWNEFNEQAEIIAEYFDYGKLEWDEVFYFQENNEYSADPFGDIDGGHLGYRIDKVDIKELIKRKKLTKEEIKKELIDYLTINFLQKKAENCIEYEKRLEKEMMEEFGFEPKEHKDYLGLETNIYSNGIIQLWYNQEDWVYNGEINVSTMHEIDEHNKELNLVF